MRKLCATVVLALVAASASPGAAGGWWTASSEHFEAYTTISEKTARSAILDFERVHAFFEFFLDVPPQRARRTRIVVFDGPKAFAPYRSNLVATAFFESSSDEDYIVLQSLNADTFPIVVHEYAHLMIRRSGAEYPLWLNEGLAEFFSTISPQGDKMRMGEPPESRLRTLATTKTLIPLDRLLAIDTSSPEYNETNQADVFYAESWVLTHMLLADEAYRAKSTDLLAAIGHGTPVAEAFTAIYAKPIAVLGRDLDRYARRNAFGYTLVPMKAAADEATVRSRAIGDAEGAAIAAAMLGRQRNRQSDARATLAALERQNPRNTVVLEERGLLEARMGDLDAARPLLARAVELGSENPQVLHAYGAALASHSALIDAETMLNRALSLAPDDIDTRIDLARLLVRGGRGGDALTVLAGVTRITRDLSFAFFEVMTMAAVQTNQPAEARAAATRAAEHARTPGEILQAKDLVQKASTTVAELVINGRLTNVICSSGPTILEVSTDTGVSRFVVDQPKSIRTGTAGATISLECGEQSRPIRVGYAAVIDTVTRTTGAVRMIEFSKNDPLSR